MTHAAAILRRAWKLVPTLLGAALFLAGQALRADHCGTSASVPSRESFNCDSRLLPGWEVYCTKSAGAPVLLLHEVNGLAAGTLRLGLALEQKGFRVYMPLLFGCYGGTVARGFVEGSFSPRWKSLLAGGYPEILRPLGELCDKISRAHGGRRVQVIGNCLTGHLPAALIARASVGSGILCQPAAPLNALSERARYALSLPQRTLDEAVRQSGQKRLLGFIHLRDEHGAHWQRFVTLRVFFKERFRPFVLRRTSPEKWAKEEASDWAKLQQKLPDAETISIQAPKGHPTLTCWDKDGRRPEGYEAEKKVVEFLHANQ